MFITGQATFDFGTSYFTEAGSGSGLSGYTANAIATIGTASVSVGPGGAITDTDTGQLTLASTDAHGIDASAGGGLHECSRHHTGEGVTVIGSSGTVNGGFELVSDNGTSYNPIGNLLQGSLGLLSSSAANYEANDGALALPDGPAAR